MEDENGFPDPNLDKWNSLNEDRGEISFKMSNFDSESNHDPLDKVRLPPYLRDFLKREHGIGSEPMTPEPSLYEIEWSDGTKEYQEAYVVTLSGFPGNVVPTITFGDRDENPLGGNFIRIINMMPNSTKMIVQIKRVDIREGDIPRS